jgi:hypothetical protein
LLALGAPPSSSSSAPRPHATDRRRSPKIDARCRGSKHRRQVMTRLTVVLAFLVLAGVGDAKAVQWQTGMNPNSIVGSFHQSCSACKVDQYGYLNCSCKNNYQIPVPSLLRLQYCSNTHGIDNIDGNLQCAPIIRGSWGASCQEGFVRGRTLSYTCSTGSSDTFHHTSGDFDLDTCPTLRLENIGGQSGACGNDLAEIVA